MLVVVATVAAAKIVLSEDISLLCCFPVPPNGFHIIFRNAFSPLITSAKVVLSPCVSLFSSAAKPLNGFYVVLLNTLAFVVAKAKATLCHSKTGCSRLVHPVQSFRFVSLNTIPTNVALINKVLCFVMAGHGCTMKQAECINILVRHTLTAIEPFSFAHKGIEINGNNVSIPRQRKCVCNHAGQNTLHTRRSFFNRT